MNPRPYSPRHPSVGALYPFTPLTSVEASAPVEAIRMIELAALVAEIPEEDEDDRK